MNIFEKLVRTNCYSKNKFLKKVAKYLLEVFYCFEISYTEVDKSVIFAHHGRGTTIMASRIYENVVIYRNVSIGSNLKYNKISNEWENVGFPIICKNVKIGVGAKILGPIIIGENSVIGAGSIITKNIPANSIAYGVNQFKPKDENYEYIYNSNMINLDEIMEANKKLIAEFEKQI